mgnify:CR=1 FL=1
MCYALGIPLRGWILAKIAAWPVMQALRKAVLLNSFKLVALTHMSPIFPDTVLNYLYSAIGYIHTFTDSFARSLIGSLIGSSSNRCW